MRWGWVADKKSILTKNTLMTVNIKEILTINVILGFEVLRVPVKMKGLSQKGNYLVFLRKGT